MFGSGFRTLAVVLVSDFIDSSVMHYIGCDYRGCDFSSSSLRGLWVRLLLVVVFDRIVDVAFISAIIIIITIIIPLHGQPLAVFADFFPFLEDGCSFARSLSWLKIVLT